MAERQPTRASFAFQPGQGAQTTRQGGSPQIGAMGNVGGGQSRSGVVRSENPGLNLNIGASLPGFLEETFKAPLEEAQRERMFRGFAAARAGQTMAEIADEQPALTALFGQSDFERGAALFAQRTAMTDLTTSVSANMAQYAAMTPEDAYRAIWEEAGTHRTGVREVDNAMDAMFIETIDSIIPTVTREQIKYRDTQLIQGGISAQMSAARSYNQMFEAAQADPANSDPNSVAQQGLNFLRGFEIAGIGPEQRATVTEQTARGLIADNNWRAWGLLTEGGSQSRLFAMLGHDDAVYSSLLNTARTAQQRYFGEATLTDPDIQAGYWEIMAKRETLAYDNASDFVTELDAWADESAARLGIDPENVLDWETQAREGRGLLSDMATEARTDAREAQAWDRNPANPVNRAREAEELQANIIAGFTSGVDSAQHTDSQRDDVMVSLISSNPAGAAEAIKRRHANGGAVLSNTARYIQERTYQQPELGPDSQGFQTSYNIWKTMQGAEHDRARIAYFGRDLDQAMRNYTTDTSRNLDPRLAYANRISRSEANPTYRGSVTVSDDIKDAVRARLTRSWYEFGTVGANDAAVTLGLSRIGDEAATVMAQNPGFPVDRAVVMAEQNLRTARLIDGVGKRLWDTPNRTPSMQSVTGMTEDVLRQNLEGVIGETMRLPRFRGIRDNQLSIVYTGNSDPTSAQWFVFAPNADGQLVADIVTPARLRQYDERNLAPQRERAMRNRPRLRNRSAEEQARRAGESGSVFRR